MGDNGWKLPGSFIVFTVRAWEFRIPSTSVISVWRDSCICNIDARIAHAERICLEEFCTILSNLHQYPPGIIGSCHLSQNKPSSVLFLYQWNYFHCQDRLISHPCLATSLLNARINESLSRLEATLIWIALLVMQVNIAPYHIASLLLCLTSMGLNMSVLQLVNGVLNCRVCIKNPISWTVNFI